MLASSPVFQKKSASGLTISSDLAFHPKPLSKSNIQSKSMQFSSHEMRQQMTALKQKAHQSFMQVIQMQQLHQQQVEQLRKQFEVKEESYHSQLTTLELRIRQLQYQNLVLQKNYRQHHFNIEENDLSIENIELISCKEESKLDQSSISNFRQIIGSQYQEKINSVRQELKKEFAAINTQNQEQKKKVQTMIQKLFQYVTHLKKEFITLQQIQAQAKRQLEQSENKNANGQMIYETLQKQTKFLGEQVSRLAGQKIKGQRKILELQRKLKQAERQTKKPDLVASKPILKGELQIKKPESFQSNDHSLDMNQFIQKSLAKTAKVDSILKSPMFYKKTKN